MNIINPFGFPSIRRFSTLIVAVVVLMNLSIGLFMVWENRYLAYGLDTLRLVGQTNEIRQLGKLPYYDAARIGLPLLGAMTSEILKLPASQSLLIPLFILLLFMPILWYQLLKQVTGWPFFSSLVIFFRALLMPPGQLNASHFYAGILFPLRFILLLRLENDVDRQKNPAKNLMCYLFLSLFSYWTYPIFALVTDGVVFLYRLYRSVLHGRSWYITSVIFFSHLMGILSHYLLFALTQSHLPTLVLFTEHTFSAVLAGISPVLLSWAVLSLYALHLSTMVLLPYVRKVVTTSLCWAKSKAFIKVNSIPASPFTHSVSYLASLSGLFFFIILYYQGITYPSWLLALLLISLFASALASFAFVRAFRFHPIIQIGFLVYIAYLIITLGQLPFNAGNPFFFDKRFFLIVSRWGILFSLLPIYLLQPRLLFSLTLSVVLLAIPKNLTFYINYFPNPRNQTIIRAMEWFNQQPNHTSVLFVSSYFRSEGLSAQEKHHAQNYTASNVPWDDQVKLGKCHPEGMLCVEQLLMYARNHGIHYLVLEDGDQYPTYPYLVHAGVSVYNDDIEIIKLL